MKLLLILMLFPIVAQSQILIATDENFDMPPVVYSAVVTSGTATIAASATTGSVTVTNDTTKDMVFFGEIGSSGSAKDWFTSMKVSATAITFKRYNAGTNSLTLPYFKAHFISGVSVRRFTINLTGGVNLIYNMWLGSGWTTTDSTKAIVTASLNHDFSTYSSRHFVGAIPLFVAPDTLRWQFNGAPSGGTLEVQVGVYDSCTVRRYYVEQLMSAATKTYDYTITSSATDKTLLIPFYSFSSTNVQDSVGTKFVHFLQTTTTNVRASRAIAYSGEVVIDKTCLQVVTFTDGTTISNDAAILTSAQTSATVTHSLNDWTRTVPITAGLYGYGGKTAQTGTKNLGGAAVGITPINSTSYTLARGATGSNADTVNVQRVQFGGVEP